jgi:hypothetical protein
MEVDLSCVKGILMAVGIPKHMKGLCILYLEPLPIYQKIIKDLGLWETSEISSQYDLEQIGSSQIVLNLEDNGLLLIRRLPLDTTN